MLWIKFLLIAESFMGVTYGVMVLFASFSPRYKELPLSLKVITRCSALLLIAASAIIVLVGIDLKVPNGDLQQRQKVDHPTNQSNS